MSILDKLDLKLHEPKRIDFYVAFRGLQLLLESGSTLQQAAMELAGEQRNESLGNALKNIGRHLGAGIGVGAAFAREKIFPSFVAPTIEAGDKAGRTTEAFAKLSEIMYLQHNLYSKVNNALFVPKIASVLMGVLIIGYVKFAIPQYMDLYKDNNIELPWLISFVTSLVNGLVDYFYLTILIIYLAVRSIKYFAQRNVDIIDGWKLKVPVYSDLHFNFLQHQFVSVMELMLESGMTIPEGLLMASKSVDNSLMKENILRIRKEIMGGKSLAYCMKTYNKHSTFDKLMISSIKIGERSNQVIKVLKDDADYYSKTLIDLIEPTSTKITFIVMIPMGLVIVGMFMFTLIPMFSYISQVTS